MKNSDLKFPFADLTALADLRDRLLANRAERARIEKLLEDLTAERARLLGSGDFEDAAVIRDLSALHSKIDLIPAKLSQLESQAAELEAAIKKESDARFNDVFREGGEVLARHKGDVENLVATVMPRAVDCRNGVTGEVSAGRDTQFFDRAVAAVVESSEVTRLVSHARSPISYATEILDRVRMVERGARLLVSARKLLGSKQELRGRVEVA